MTPRPLIYTERSRAHYLIDVTLTALGWLFFFLLFATGTFNLLIGRLPGSHELWTTSPFVATTRLLIIYAVLAGVIAAILIGWALYNDLRFSGKSRRKPTPPLPEEQLQSSFSLALGLLERIRNARVMVIAHEDDSAISGIEILGKGAPPPPPAQPAAPTLPAFDRRIEPTLHPAQPGTDPAHGGDWHNPAPAS